MDNENCFENFFESVPDYRMFVFLMLIKNDVDFLTECGFLKTVISRLCLEF